MVESMRAKIEELELNNGQLEYENATLKGDNNSDPSFKFGSKYVGQDNPDKFE